MSGVEIKTINPAEDGMRLDRWFKEHYPALGHGALQKLLRTGQVRIDGSRAKAGDRVSAGQSVRVPPLPDHAPSRPKPRVSDNDAKWLQSLIIHRDEDVLALNKPTGLAVQGGTKTERHLDGMLDALILDAAERPRLVHRLDRDTSGVLLLARNRQAAMTLAQSFKSREALKVYWAIVRGVPKPWAGTINLPLKKVGHAGDQRVAPAERGDEAGQHAVTDYMVLAHAGKRAAFVALSPRTGRTHQLRAHMAALGHPIIGDRKYGGEEALLGDEIDPMLHLHARGLAMEHPRKGRLRIIAQPSDHFRRSMSYLGFTEPKDDPFAPFAEI
ncbi:RluA family pseudouridine synthase [Rhodoligotrophos ferricapiens]|uniref:RluA family pseudouridine synthase n=1 Tax=Rhodoligotrophos ferricapiens TaxID=3069264 RepID=UPI00315DCC59